MLSDMISTLGTVVFSGAARLAQDGKQSQLLSQQVLHLLHGSLQVLQELQPPPQ